MVGTCAYPLDPGIALRGSQTIYPLNRDFCLILTNLEYAKDPSTSPLEKRTFARNFRQSMTRVDAFIRTRKLTGQEVAQINFVIKARARRYVAAGRKEWLGAVRRLVGIEVGVVSGVFNLESPGVDAPGWRLRHEEAYHAA
jgi:hypothetical protein